MACTYDTRWEDEQAHAQRIKELDKLTRMLCTVCEHLESQADGPYEVNEELGEWWEKHQEEDRAKEAAAEAFRESAKQARISEIKKLEKRIKELKKKN